MRNNHLLKTITVEKIVVAETMTSCGEAARALHSLSASPACLSRIQLAPSDKSYGIEHSQKLRPESFSDIMVRYSHSLETLGY